MIIILESVNVKNIRKLYQFIMYLSLCWFFNLRSIINVSIIGINTVLSQFSKSQIMWVKYRRVRKNEIFLYF